MEEEPASPKVEFLMAVAGPLASLFLALVFSQIERLALLLDWPTALVGVSSYLAFLNLLLAVFNLIPAFPLDGGRMLRAALWHWQRDLRRATYIASQIGSGFGLALMILGGLSFFQGSFIGGMWWLLIGAFLRSAAGGSYRQMLVRELLSDKPIRDFMNSEPVTVSPDTSVQTLIDDYVYRHHFKMLPVLDDARLLGCVTTRDIKELPRERWPHTEVRELLSPCSAENTVSPDASASTLISAIARPGAVSRFMVVEDDRLVGVISMRDLSEYIALRLELEPSGR
jgi:CBS domain-containing protein